MVMTTVVAGTTIHSRPARTPDDKIWVAVRNADTLTQIDFYYSSDDGSSFTKAASSATSPHTVRELSELVVDVDGNLHLGIRHEPTGGKYCTTFIGQPNGVTDWTWTKLITWSFNEHRDLRMVVFKSGTSYYQVILTDMWTGTASQIFVWRNVVDVSTLSVTQTRHDVTISSTSRVYRAQGIDFYHAGDGVTLNANNTAGKVLVTYSQSDRTTQTQFAEVDTIGTMATAAVSSIAEDPNTADSVSISRYASSVIWHNPSSRWIVARKLGISPYMGTFSLGLTNSPVAEKGPTLPAATVQNPELAYDKRGDIWLTAPKLNNAATLYEPSYIGRVSGTWEASYTVLVTPSASSNMLFVRRYTEATPEALDVTFANGTDGTALTQKLFNQPPNAPTRTAPTDGSTLDRNIAQTFKWNSSDPDAGDSQSAYQVDYRKEGETTWLTTGKVESANEQHEFAALTFDVANYEWRVRTWDQSNEVGPYSDIGFFSAGNPPPAPTITDPANNATIASDSYTLQWSTTSQEAYRVRTVADNAGSPDTSIIYHDTGIVEDPNARSRTIPFPTNNRFEHIQLQILRDGLWSTWSSVRVEVSYTPPAAPTFTLSTPGPYVLVDVTNPTPASGEPTVTDNEVERREPGGSWTRIAVGVGNSGQYQDYHAGARTYEYRVRANGDNGTSTLSAINSVTLVLSRTWIHEINNPSGTIRQFLYDGHGKSRKRTKAQALQTFVGRTFPRVSSASERVNSLDVGLRSDSEQDLLTLEEFWNQNRMLCYRDQRGRKLFATLTKFDDTDEAWGGYGVEITLATIDYTEKV